MSFKCPHWKICENYRDESDYCNDFGGDFCGTHRWHDREKDRVKNYLRHQHLVFWIIIILNLMLSIWLITKLT